MVRVRTVAWRSLAPILGVHFIGTLGYSIALPFLVFLVSDLGGAAWTYGVLGSTYSLFQLVGAPLLGRWSDRVGRRTVLLVSQGGTLVAWLVFLGALALPRLSVVEVAGASFTLPLLLVFAARAFDGLTGGNVSVANAYVADLTVDTPEVRGVAFGRMGMAANAGFVMGPAVAGVLGVTALGYTLPVAVAAGVSLAATLLVVLALPEPSRPCPTGPPDDPSIARTLGQQLKRCDRPEPVPTSGVLRRPEVASLLVATFLMFMAFSLFYAGFPIHAERGLGWSVGQLGLFFAVLSAAMIPTQGPLLAAATRIATPRVLFAAGMAAFVACFLALSSESPAALYAGALLFAVANGLSWPCFQARVAEVAGPEQQGAVQGATTSVGSLASIAGLLLGGFAYPLLGGHLFVVVAVLFGLVGFGTPLWFRGGPGRV